MIPVNTTRGGEVRKGRGRYDGRRSKGRVPVWTKGLSLTGALGASVDSVSWRLPAMQARLKADNGDRTPTASVTTLENSPRTVTFYVLKWTNTTSI